MNKGERDAMKDQCVPYLLEAGTIPRAKKLAKRDGFSANTSTWIGALSWILAQVNKAQERRRGDGK